MDKSARTHGKMWNVYVLKNLNGKHYTGCTSHLERRLVEHNSGKTKSIRLIRPFELVYKEGYKSRLEALRRERFLKSGKGREFLKNMGI